MLEVSEVAKAVTSASAVGAMPSAWTLHKHRRWLEPTDARPPPCRLQLAAALHENIVLCDVVP